MPAVDEMLADLAAHPPAEPSPIGVIQGRARRRVRRRRALAGAAAAVVLVAVGVALGAAVTAGDPADEVRADGGDPPTLSSADPTGPSSSVAAGEGSLTLDPATGQEVGSRVRVTSVGAPPAGEVWVAQCASEVLTAAPADLLDWCVAPATASSATAVQTIVVHGSLRTVDGVIACDDGPGRCVIVMASGDPVGTELRSAPIVLDDSPPAAGEVDVEVDGDEGTVGDGDALLVTVRGVDTGESILVQQCRTDLHPSAEDRTDGQCDQARYRNVQVQEGPETQLTVTAFHDLHVDPAFGAAQSAWVPCEPCELVVRVSERTVRFPILMEAVETPIRPVVTIEPEGRHVPGARVTVRATGLAPDSTVAIGWCPVVVPEGGGASACTGPGGGLVTHDVDGDGALVIPDFLLPGPDDLTGFDCVGVPGTCGVGIDTGGVRPLAVAPLDLSG